MVDVLRGVWKCFGVEVLLREDYLISYEWMKSLFSSDRAYLSYCIS